MENIFSSTVAAVSTPRGKGGVALIRISGVEAVTIAGRCFSPKCRKAVEELSARTAYFGDILLDGKIIDDGLITVFKAPHSYTGEDMVEISCHGGMLVTERVLEATFLAGAVSAPAGEFTRRAFLNGKLTLTGAEAIAEILDAKSDAQLKIASVQRRGALTAKLSEIANKLVSLVAGVYARIDYPEEDLGEISDDEFTKRCGEISERITSLCETYKSGSAIFEGVNTVICGAPNRGKSSLYNAIAGDDAAIVTSVAGTTRDVLERSIPFGKVLLRLADTAGIHETDDEVEKIGVLRAVDRTESAELILSVFDGSHSFERDDGEICRMLEKTSAAKIAVINKSDLDAVFALPKEYENIFDAVISISASRGEGIDLLRKKVEELFIDGKIDTENDAMVTNARQFSALTASKELIADAVNTCKNGYGSDLAASDLERAIALINEVDGRSVTEDIVGEIFSHFCVGK